MSSECTGDISRRRALATLAAAPGILRGAGDSFGRRLEPESGRVLHGAGQSPEAFKEYFDHIGETKPVVYMSYCGLKRATPQYFSRLSSLLSGFPVFLIPQIGLSMTRDGSPEEHYEHEVAEGKHDAQIEVFCEGLRQLNRPAFVRIGYEFSGQWNGYQPETYREAWIRIVNALREHQLEEAASAWCYAPDAKDKEYMNYYPGDGYVDWWCIDLFSAQHFTATDTISFMEDAHKRRFPVMIGESTPRRVGVLEGEKSWSDWFQLYFGFMERYRHTKAFCYINWNWANYPKWKDWGDCRIERNEVVLERWGDELKRSKYVHGASEPAVRAALKAK